MRKERSLWRIHRAVHEPLFFGKGAKNRFDAPEGEFGVLYAGMDAHCAFIETFGHSTGIRVVTAAELDVRELSLLRASRSLRLVDLRAEGLARMGADAELTSGPDYPLAQRWSRALHDHPAQPDGLIYLARHDPSRSSVALFERVAPLLTSERLGAPTGPSQTKRLGDILDTYRFGLL